MGWLFMCLHLLLFHFSSFSSSFSSSSNFLCHHEESSALLQFKSSVSVISDDEYIADFIIDCGGEPLMKISTWKNGTDCCSWHGVTCDTISSHVIGLNLACEGLQGEVPTQISHLLKLESLHLSRNNRLFWNETTLKRLVQNATNLRELFLDYTDMSSIRPNSMNLIFNQSSSLITLNLGYTSLRGSLKDNVICLPSIQDLNMSGNSDLQGQLPKLSCSTSLRILDLSYCQFQGSIPLSFSNLTNLIFLSLMENNLNGSISSSLLTSPQIAILYLKSNKLSGQIPNVFHRSNMFQELDLSDNKIEGEMPISLSNLQQLIHLDLSFNSLNSQIPDVFSGMTKLQELILESNNLEGQIPPSIFNMTQLITLDCSNNKLEGPLPNKVTKFQNLTSLNLSNNLLNGTIPSWCLSLPTLENLDLSVNQLTGHINVISSYFLEELSLCDNKLQGNIPESIFNLTYLSNLCLSSNNLSGVIDFQHFSNKLQNLLYLHLSHNSQLSLNIESNVNYKFFDLCELGLSSLSLTELPKLSETYKFLEYLDLSNNKFNGRVPNWLIETMGSQGYLNLSQNMFTSIEEISKEGQLLEGLDLSFNLLRGELPVSICNMSSLQMLNLANNKLTGIIPQCLANLQLLDILDLQMNKFHGTLPSNFSKYNWFGTLNLYGNQLEGHLPKSLSNCTNLEVLNLGNNKIEDTFPYWLQTLERLNVLVLRDNKFHGPILNITIKYPFSSLIIFDISGNNFSGPLPEAYLKNYDAVKNAQIGEDKSFQYMDYKSYWPNRIYSQYYDSVNVTTKGNKMTLVKIPTTFVSIDFSRNYFEGQIPDVIGELHALKGLNLSHNRLTGHIPKSIGNLTNLESLDLSSNILTGFIPAELTNMNSLEVLNLSNNHLVGEIPQGKQFNTFSNDSYEGNLGLCGVPLSMECGPVQHSPPSPENFTSEEKFGFGWKPVAIGYGCGTVFGIGLGCCVFLMGKPRWLVMLFGGQPKRRVRRKTRVRRTTSFIIDT